jgi:hypothetical protein
LREGAMSYKDQLRRLAAIERDLKEMYRDLSTREGDVFDRTLESLLDQLYGAHEMLCQAAASASGDPPSRTA